MAITYTWSVTAMDCHSNDGSNTDVVFNVHWRCVGTDGQYTASVYSTCIVYGGPSNSFTPYADLTQDQVLGWIWTHGVDQATVQADVAQQIQNQINPPVVTLPLPWST